MSKINEIFLIITGPIYHILNGPVTVSGRFKRNNINKLGLKLALVKERCQYW